MNVQIPPSTELSAQTQTQVERILQQCEQARRFEEKSDYEAARTALGELWVGLGERPNIAGLDEQTQAEVLLRVGTLTGWISSTEQIEESQERAKDLISEGARLFARLGRTERVAEARINLAVCYWREGALDEARTMLQEPLQLGDAAAEQKLRAMIALSLVEVSSSRYREALKILEQAAPLSAHSENDALRGKFHNQYALVLKRLGETEHREDFLDRALIEYTAASYHWEQAGDLRFCAAVENNIGGLLIACGKIRDAHLHLNRARQIAVQLKDKLHVAWFDETRARAFLAEGRNAEAEKIARRAVRVLQGGGEAALLVETLTTHARALARLGRHRPAKLALTVAIELGEQMGSLEGAGQAALTLIEELGDVLNAEALRAGYHRAEELLSRCQDAAIWERLGRCARRILATELRQPQSSVAAPAATDETWSGCALKQEVLRYEEQLISRALDASDGRVTHAARLLRMSHQALVFTLNTRHKHLLPFRNPARKRRRSLIRKR
jgi:tetratricopeptide (TPR) repeat protein